VIAFEGVSVGELGLFRKKKPKPAAPAEPPAPPQTTPPSSALFLETQKTMTPGFPWLTVTIITASVLVIGVSAFLIFRKSKKN
jgi:hypothetical protein